MKKIIALISFVLLLVFLFGCTNHSVSENGNNTANNSSNSSNNSNNTNNTNNTNDNGASSSEKLKITDYYPIKENVKYVYEGSGNEYAAYTVYIDYTSEDKVQQRVDNGGTVSAKVIEVKDGKVTRLLSKGEVYYRENLLQAAGDEEILLMEPLVKGTTWKLKDSRTRSIADTAVEVTTPSGSYKAIEVVTEGTSDKTIDYYAKDVGLVKSVFTSGGTEVTSSLSKIEEDASLIQKVSFFYPNVNDGKIYYRNKDITFKTNDITRETLASAYKELIDNNLGKVFSPNTKINSLYLNKDGMVYIDLSKEFLTEMNAGSGYESMILQSIADTFGKYYNAQRIILTIDNNLYASGHIAMEKGQYIEVKYDNTVELK